jgi:hypothetical protein
MDFFDLLLIKGFDFHLRFYRNRADARFAGVF